jgi:hypothetical protein
MKKTAGRTIIIAATLVGAAFATTSTASAEKIIRAVYHINLTDAASGTTLTTSRLSIRSWPKMDQCEAQSSNGNAFHVKAVEGYGIKNSAGKPLAVTIKSVECID